MEMHLEIYYRNVSYEERDLAVCHKEINYM